MKDVVMAITGASGAVYARGLVRGLVRADVHLHLVISQHGRRVLDDELGTDQLPLQELARGPAAQVTLYAHDDIGARIASGSFRTAGMVVCPCSSNTLGGIAAGTAENLITRAAMVTLKERRKLVLVTREMPLTQIEIGNMLRVSQAGAIVCPAAPGFYMQPRTIADLVDFVVGRVLDLLDVPHELNTRWAPSGREGPGPAGDETG
jgi:4-hydroxy-3-polyprenylbenzoate decarboxylase